MGFLARVPAALVLVVATVTAALLLGAAAFGVFLLFRGLEIFFDTGVDGAALIVLTGGLLTVLGLLGVLAFLLFLAHFLRPRA